MSDEPFPYQPALMSAVRARDLSRTYKGLAEQLRLGGMTELADQAERDATWWIAYATSLAETPPGRIDHF